MRGRLLRIAAFTSAPWESACPTLRIVSPCEVAGLTLLRGSTGGWLDQRVDASVVDDADVVVVQRDFARDAEAFDSVAARARARGKPLVYDLDDLLTDLPEDHPQWEEYRHALWPIRWAVAAADAVTVSTPALRDVLQEINPHIYVLPNYLDDRLWQPDAAPSHDDDPGGGPLTLGYMGTHTHALDLALVAPALQQVATRYGDAITLEFLGGSPLPVALAELPNVRQDPQTQADYGLFAAWFAQRRWDLAIAPLRDTAFSRCKSNLKFLEYSALGIPGVYSRITPYVATVEEDAGILAGSTEEWVTALEGLIADRARREAMGRAARQKVRAGWMLSAHAGEWPQAYRQIIEVQAAAQRWPYHARFSRLRAWQEEEGAELARQSARVEQLEAALAERGRIAERQIGQLSERVTHQDELIRWLEAELEKMRRSITWRGTEPVRQAYARVQALQRARARRPGESAGSPAAPAAAEPPLARGDFGWTPARLAGATARPLSPVTDVIVCVGRDAQLAERCIAAIRRSTPGDAYRLHLVVHEADLGGLPEQARENARVHLHAMSHFNFARANNLALAHCPGDVVLLNDDTEVTAGWLERLRADSRGMALTGARTGEERSGNPDTWGEGDSRLTVYPINMFCAFIPQRVRAVVGDLDEEYAYYGGEDVDYSARALLHGFPLLVSSAFVHHAGAGSFKSRKQRLMEESDKILRERYGVTPPWELSRVGPLVSVILTTRDHAAQLPASAESVLGGRYRALELILVDDASEDDTPAAIEALQRSDHRVIGVRLPKQSGIAQARMRGLAVSRGQFVAFLDDVNMADPDRILAPLQAMMLQPQLDVIYGGLGPAPETRGDREQAQPLEEAAFLALQGAAGAGFLLTRRHVLRATPFLTHYERALDLDWAFRVLRGGYGIGYLPLADSGSRRKAGADAPDLVIQEIRERERLMKQYGRS